MKKTYGFWILCFILSNTLLLKGQTLDKTNISEKPISVFDKPVDFSGWQGDILNPEELSEIRIGLFIPNDRTNPATLPILNSAQLAISESNAAGGYYGVPFRLVERWAYDPWGAGSKEMIKLVYQDSVWAVIGSLDGDATHIAQQIVTKAWVPLLSPLCSDPTLTYIRIPWMFRLPPDYQNQAQVIVNKGIRAMSIEKIGLVSSNTHDGRIFSGEMIKELQAKHITPVFHFQLSPSRINFQDITQRVLSFEIESVIINLPQDDLINLLFNLQKYEGRIFVFLPWIPGLEKERLRQKYVGEIYYIEPFAQVDNPVFKKFSRAYKQQYNTIPPPGAAYIYDAVNLLVRSIRQSGLNRPRLRDAIAGMDNFEGASGKISWDNGGGNQALPILRSLSDN
jgi:branched-chain amino acid transport system substrate-binding protein